MANDIMKPNAAGKALSIKEMFNRPGGTFAKVTAVLAALGLGFGLFKALPFLVAAASNLLTLILEIVAIAVILGVLTSKNFWKWVSLFWLQLNRKIVGIFVKIDPISILENSIYKMKEKMNNVHESVTKLRAILIKMNDKLEEYEANQNDNILKLKKRKEQLEQGGISANEQLKINMSIKNLSNDIAQLDKIIESQKKRIETSKKYQEVMERLEIIADASVEGSELELKRTKDAYEAAKEQKSALKTISGIFNGDMKGLEEEMAIEHITDTINMSLAEMERFINDSNGVLDNYELESAINEDKVQGILDKYTGESAFQSLKIQAKLSAEDVPYKEVEVMPAGRRNKWC